MQGRAHAQEMQERILITPRTDLKIDLHSQTVKAKAELSATCWSVEIMLQQTENLLVKAEKHSGSRL